MDGYSAPDIMIVDDSDILREGIVFMLEKEGYAVKDFNNPEQFIVELLFAQNLPRIILSDYDMPGMTGLDIVRVLKGTITHNHLPILIMSAHKDESIKAEVLEAGAVGWVEKTSLRKEILPAIQQYILK